MQPIETIDEVIEVLGEIIRECEKTNNTGGYFAALYRKVTIKVKEGIENDFFDDGRRMERLDVIFAKRYIEAWFAWRADKEVTNSWRRAFEIENRYWPAVVQHLLLGMNAHINLDLGIAASETSGNDEIESLRNDFLKINKILASIVDEVQHSLSGIWPPLKWILSKSKKIDNYLTDFSMELARNGAWKFAVEVAGLRENDLEQKILERDEKVARKASVVTKPGFFPTIGLRIIRLGEAGSVSSKIGKMKQGSDKR